MKIKKKLLLLLAAFLDKLPPERFNLCYWVRGDWRGKPDLSCGTTACGIGWASTMPEFRKLGLRLDKKRFFPYLVNKSRHRRPEYVRLGEIFGLDEYQFRYLFIHCSYYNGEFGLHSDATAKDLANHIRSFVKEYAS